jgi:plastocyanin
MRSLSVVCVLFAVLAAVGCGTNKKTASARTNTGQAGHSGGVYQLIAEDGLKFDKKVITTTAGSTELQMTNQSSQQHDIAIKGHGIDMKGKVVGKGGHSEVVAVLKPGTYEFYCSVDGHAAAGMKGTIKVGMGGGTG